jgi:Methyltransferase domain
MSLTDISRTIRNYLLRFDTPNTLYFWEYYNRCIYAVSKIKTLGRENPAILDVGGATGQLLEKFGLKNVTIVDYLSGADVIGDGKMLPFRDNTFDVVTALDVFEHIEKSDRLAVACEMLRVSRRMVIIIAPQDTPLNVSAEKTVLKYCKYDWLVEHARRGLVDFDELEGHLQKHTKYHYDVEELDNLMNWVAMFLCPVKNVSDIYQEIFPFENKAAFRRKALTVQLNNK